jgi:TonB family protein
MANVDAEQNAAPTQQSEGTAPSEFTLSEENLEALLHGVSGSAPLPKPTASAPAPAGAMQKPGQPDQITKIEPATKEEPIASLASLQGTPPMEAVAPPPFEASPAVVTPLQPASQPDVNSKLALISAIKQRRAVTARLEPAPETETFAPVESAAGVREEEQGEPEAVGEHVAPDTEAVSEEEIAATPKAEPVSRSRPTPVASAPAARPVKAATEVQPQAALPAKKVWANSATGEPEPRRTDARRTETPRPEAAKRVAPKATVAAPAAAAADASESNELFASFSSGIPEQEAAKPQSFVTSKAGMGVIGGAIAAAALAIYFLTAHSSPKQSAAVNVPATPPVEVSGTVAPAASSSDGKTPAPAVNQHTTAATPVTAQQPGTKIATTAVGQPAAQQIPAGYSQQNAIAQQRTVPQQPTSETPRTTARAFTAPTAARPASSTVVDAAPALTINTATPSGVVLPARIAPLPPPPAPAAPAQAPAPPRQLNVAGAVQAAKLTHQVVPAYPAVAKAARVQGVVHFRALIGADGAVKALTTLGGPLPLAQAASEAVKQWHYQPTIVDGKPVEITTQIDVAFTL